MFTDFEEFIKEKEEEERIYRFCTFIHRTDSKVYVLVDQYEMLRVYGFIELTTDIIFSRNRRTSIYSSSFPIPIYIFSVSFIAVEFRIRSKCYISI